MRNFEDHFNVRCCQKMPFLFGQLGFRVSIWDVAFTITAFTIKHVCRKMLSYFGISQDLVREPGDVAQKTDPPLRRGPCTARTDDSRLNSSV